MQNLIVKIKDFIKNNKKTSIAIGILIIVIGYFTFNSLTSTSGETTYVLGTVSTNTVVASLTGSGQVSTNRQLDLKPQATGNIVYVGSTIGQKVHAGDTIAEIDPTTAKKAVRDAEANLQSAQLSLQKLQQPADPLSILQAQDSLAQSKANLSKAYDDGFNSVSSAFLDLPTIMTGLDSALHNTNDVSPTSQQNIAFYADTVRPLELVGNKGKVDQYAADAEQKYQAARTAYTQNFSDYKNASRTSDTATIQNLIDETHTTTGLISDAVKSAQNLIQYYQDVLTSTNLVYKPAQKSYTYLTNLLTYTNQINGHVSDLLTVKNTIDTNNVAVPEKTQSLKQLEDGANTIDLQSAQLAVQQKQNALQDAKDTLANYYIQAPFDGTVAKIDVNVGDPANSSTVIATLIDNQQVVDIPLNEVDAAKVKFGDKSTLTFDAVDSLVLTGKVISIDTVGTVTQGVVNYTATISFDSMDPRVKSGMSTTASIITDVHSDVVSVPSSAIKSSGSSNYVLVFDTIPTKQSTTINGGVLSSIAPTQVPVTIGISDDTNTEIISGLTSGQTIVTRSIAPTTGTTSATPSATSLLGGGARGGGASGALRGVSGAGR